MDYFRLKINNNLRFNSIKRIYDIEWKQRLKLLRDFDIVYTGKHPVDVIFNSKTYTLLPYQVLMGQPGNTVQAVFKNEHVAEVYTVHFSADTPKTLSQNDLANKIDSIDDTAVFDSSIFFSHIVQLDTDYVGNCFELMINELKFKKYGYEKTLNLYLLQILHEISRACITKIIYHSYDFDYETGNFYVRRIIEFLHLHYTSKLKSLDVEAHVGRNYDYLNRIFKKVVGISIMNYVDKIRITRAKELIETTDFKLYEISEMVGIEDSHYFSKKFKLFEGKTPSELRKEEYLR